MSDVKVMDRAIYGVDVLPERRREIDVTDWYEIDGKLGIKGVAYVGPYVNGSEPRELRLIAGAKSSGVCKYVITAIDPFEMWYVDVEELR